MESGKKFLRCLIKGEESENLLDNAFRIIDAPIDFFHIDSDLQEIYKFTKKFYDEIGDLPTFSLLDSEFERRGLLGAKDVLEDIKKFPIHTASSFEFIKKEVIKELHQSKFNALLSEVSKINLGELKIGKKTLAGTKPALDYLLSKSEEYYYESANQKADIEMSESGEGAIKRLENAKENNLINYGILSGIKPIDMGLTGVKLKELMIIAGSTGECKTTLSLNYGYNAAINGGFNVLIVTLEMPKEIIQDKLYCLHANNKKIQREIEVDIYTTYNAIRTGSLSPRQEAYYRYAVNDWDNRGVGRPAYQKAPDDKKFSYGKFTIWQPDRRLSPTLLLSKMNMLNRSDPIHLVIVDHPGLMSPDDAGQYKGETSSLNEIMKQLKRIAMTFNNNTGVAMIAPFQINREGKKNVVKRTEKSKESKEGKTFSIQDLEKPLYSTYDLSYANEAERSADSVIYTYLDDDLRKTNKLSIGCIKSRHGGLFTPFTADTALPAGMIWYIDPNDQSPTGKFEELEL